MNRALDYIASHKWVLLGIVLTGCLLEVVIAIVIVAALGVF